MSNPQSTAEPAGNIAPVGSFTDQVFVYRYLPADGSLDNLARRFRVEVTAIWTLNGRHTSWQPSPGEVLLVPRPTEAKTQDGRAWEQYDVTESCHLMDLLEQLSREGKLWATGSGNGEGNVGNDEALEVWRYWRNASVRQDVLARSPDANGGAQGLAGFTDASGVPLASALPSKDLVEMNGPSAAALEEGDVIFLPLTPLGHTTIAVAPNATATVDLTPTPLVVARRMLSHLHDVLERLTGIRAEAQRVRAECTSGVRILHQLRALVEAEQAQYDSVAYIALHPGEGDNGRAALKLALNRLITQATPCLLHAPLSTVAPDVQRRLNREMSDLVGSLKSPKLRQLLDVVIPQAGEVHCYLDGVVDPKNFVETVCALAAQASYWLAEEGSVEARALLEAAVSAMASGAKASAGSTSSLLDYAAGLLPAGPTFSPSCAGDAAVSYCGLVTNLYLAGSLTRASVDINASAARVSKAVMTMLGVDMDAYAVEAPRALTSTPEGSGFASAKKLWSGTKGIIAKAREASRSKGAALKSGGDEELTEIEHLISLFFEVPEAPEKLLGKLGGRIGTMRTIWAVAKRITSTQAPVTGATATFSVVPKSDTDELISLLKLGERGAETAASALKTMKKLGLLDTMIAEEGTAVLGQITLGLSALLQFAEAEDAFAASKYQEGEGHLLEGVGFLCLMSGNPVLVLVGGAVLVAGNVLASRPEFFTLQAGADRFFREKFAHFRIHGDKFEALQQAIASIGYTLTDKTLPVLDELQFKAYAPLLEGTGLTSADVTQ